MDSIDRNNTQSIHIPSNISISSSTSISIQSCPIHPSIQFPKSAVQFDFSACLLDAEKLTSFLLQFSSVTSVPPSSPPGGAGSATSPSQHVALLLHLSIYLMLGCLGLLLSFSFIVCAFRICICQRWAFHFNGLLLCRALSGSKWGCSFIRGAIKPASRMCLGRWRRKWWGGEKLSLKMNINDFYEN